jgi:hypothetical protein
MPFTHEQAVEAGRARWAGTTPEQRREASRKARLAAAVKALVDQAPALTEDQKPRIRAILAQTPSGGAQ